VFIAREQKANHSEEGYYGKLRIIFEPLTYIKGESPQPQGKKLKSKTDPGKWLECAPLWKLIYASKPSVGFPSTSSFLSRVTVFGFKARKNSHTCDPNLVVLQTRDSVGISTEPPDRLRAGCGFLIRTQLKWMFLGGISTAISRNVLVQ